MMGPMHLPDWFAPAAAFVGTAVGVFLPNEKPVAAAQRLGALVRVLALGAGAPRLKGLPMPENPITLFPKALAWLGKNPWVETEAVDEAMLAFALVNGDTAALTPKTRQCIQDAPIPEPWKSILMSDLGVAAIVALETRNAQALLAQLKQAPQPDPTPAPAAP